MLWTIMPEDAVMADSDKLKNPEEYWYKNKRILGYPTAEGKVCIARIISSDPKDFLDPALQPGMVVDCRKM